MRVTEAGQPPGPIFDFCAPSAPDAPDTRLAIEAACDVAMPPALRDHSRTALIAGCVSSSGCAQHQTCALATGTEGDYMFSSCADNERLVRSDCSDRSCQLPRCRDAGDCPAEVLGVRWQCAPLSRAPDVKVCQPS